MDFEKIIENGKMIAAELEANLSDPNKQTASKQVYFMDNNEKIKRCMAELNQVVASIGASIGDDPEVIDSEMASMLNEAKSIIQNMRQTIGDFQKLLMISSDVSEEQTTPALNEATLKAAQQNNSTTQEIVQNMDAIAKAKAVKYNYALMCDGTISLLYAATKEELNKSINAIADSGKYKDIKLFSLTFTPVPLKQKTILSV